MVGASFPSLPSPSISIRGTRSLWKPIRNSLILLHGAPASLPERRAPRCAAQRSPLAPSPRQNHPLHPRAPLPGTSIQSLVRCIHKPSPASAAMPKKTRNQGRYFRPFANGILLVSGSLRGQPYLLRAPSNLASNDQDRATENRQSHRRHTRVDLRSVRSILREPERGHAHPPTPHPSPI